VTRCLVVWLVMLGDEVRVVRLVMVGPGCWWVVGGL
jgi:hypothetical protein